jgi:peroxiredoxin
MIGVGERAPDFELPGLDGLTYALHEADADGPVLLAIWRSTCGTCRLAAPYLSRLADAYENLGWTFWAIAQDDAAAARAFVQQYGFTPTVLVDGPALAVSRAYDPETTPTLWLVEPGKGVTLVSEGFSKEDLNEISRRVAGYVGAEHVEVAPDGDGNPRFKPG